MAIAITEAWSAGRTVAALLNDAACAARSAHTGSPAYRRQSSRKEQGPYPEAEEDGPAACRPVGTGIGALDGPGGRFPVTGATAGPGHRTALP
ncbi:hypothetical protein GCM10022232_71800 [Streptomyces plumbiresistens]|uniref:Uncharacterized protein n=1 Tax=Streptomyces plumbiresistens TaxID=511811 RepID=A0ABP7SXG7_9ACTN